MLRYALCNERCARRSITRCEPIFLSTVMSRHSLVHSSMMFSIRNALPLSVLAVMKS